MGILVLLLFLHCEEFEHETCMLILIVWELLSRLKRRQNFEQQTASVMSRMIYNHFSKTITSSK
jgi:hypothetical protein